MASVALPCLTSLPGVAKQSPSEPVEFRTTVKVVHPISQSALTYRLYRRQLESDRSIPMPDRLEVFPASNHRRDGRSGFLNDGAGTGHLIRFPRAPALGGLHDARHRCDLRDLESGHLHHPLSHMARQAAFRCGPPQ